MINMAISGAHGRMGQAIIKLALEDNDIQIKTLLEHKDHPKCSEAINGIAVSADNSQLNGCDALIEFTLPEGTIQNLHAAVDHNVRMVIGTTGFSKDQIKEIEHAAKKIPVVFSSNMSIGVNVLFKLIEIAGSKLDANRIDIKETHHIHKKDKPSGTAKTMAERVQDSSGKTVDNVESFREGEVVGDHEIIFETPEDILTIAHHAKDRRMFAKGAVTAAKWLMDKKPGLYHMQDVLDLNKL